MDHAGLQKKVTSEAMVVDVTPPIPGSVEIISLSQTKWTGDDVLRVDILNFIDEESSIDYYTLFIGSYAYSMDIVQEIQGTDEMVEVNLGGLDLKDGHVYFLGVKVIIFCADILSNLKIKQATCIVLKNIHHTLNTSFH